MTSIRSLIIAVCFLALSFFGGVSEARAENPAGHFFCDQGIQDPQDLIQRIRESATDTAPLRGCRATTRHFIQAYQIHVRTHGIDATVNTKADLIAWLSTFVEVEGARDAEYMTDCLWTVNGRTRVRVDCEQRQLRNAEKVYGVRDREGNLVVLLYTNCANPGSGEVRIVVTADPCITLIFPTTFVGQPVRGVYIGPRSLPGRCHELTAAGMSEPFPSWPEECPDRYQAVRDGRTIMIVCDWSDVEINSTRILGQPVQVQNVSFSYNARAVGGNNVWVLPREALEGLPTICWEMPDGTFRTLSVGRDSFVNGVATITVEHMETIRWSN